jgi:hypothetical protein
MRTECSGQFYRSKLRGIEPGLIQPQVYVAKGATKTTDIVVDKPQGIKPATNLGLDLVPNI